MNEQTPAVKKVQSAGREFTVIVARFSNGCFVAVSEGSDVRMGALAMSVKTIDRPATSILIPHHPAGIYASLFSEFASKAVDGIALTSFYVKSELEPASLKQLLSEIKELIA